MRTLSRKNVPGASSTGDIFVIFQSCPSFFQGIALQMIAYPGEGYFVSRPKPDGLHPFSHGLWPMTAPLHRGALTQKDQHPCTGEPAHRRRDFAAPTAPCRGWWPKGRLFLEVRTPLEKAIPPRGFTFSSGNDTITQTCPEGAKPWAIF